MAYKRISPQPVIEGGSGATTLTGVLTGNGTSAFTASAVTQHDVLVGGTSNVITSVVPSATSGVPLISQGSSSDPAFGTAVVAGGGTGLTSTTAYAVLCGGTTSTAALQSIASVGTSGQVLTSNGASALPTFQAVPGGSATGTPVQQKRTTSSSKTSTSSEVNITATPTTSNTVSLLSISFTPTSSSNTLLFEAAISVFPNTATNAATSIFCLFSGTTLLATFPINYAVSAGQVTTARIFYYETAGTTSATTYAIYYASGLSAGTTYINQDSAGNAWGNSLTSTFMITEVIT